MKQNPFAFIFVACLPLGSLAVEIGDTRDSVISELGKPTGSAGVGDRTVLFFSRGEVTLRDDRVVATNLISAEELSARAAAEAEAIQRMEAAAQARLAKLESEGRAIYAAKKSDPSFAALPAGEQLNYWRAFATRYPMIPVAAEIAPLAERVEHELRLRELELAQEDRLAEMEDRIATAEERARRAEREARRDRYDHPYFGRPDFPRPGHPQPPAHRDQQPRTTPVLNPVDADRAAAMADIEADRQRAYTGGASPELPPEEPVRHYHQNTPRR